MTFQRAVKLADLKSGRFTKAEVLGVDLCFTLRDGEVICLENSCSHMGLPIDRAVEQGNAEKDLRRPRP